MLLKYQVNYSHCLWLAPQLNWIFSGNPPDLNSRLYCVYAFLSVLSQLMVLVWANRAFTYGTTGGNIRCESSRLKWTPRGYLHYLYAGTYLLHTYWHFSLHWQQPCLQGIHSHSWYHLMYHSADTAVSVTRISLQLLRKVLDLQRTSTSSWSDAINESRTLSHSRQDANSEQDGNAAVAHQWILPRRLKSTIYFKNGCFMI